VYNSSFKALADVKQTVASWAAGTKSLVDMMKNNEMKSKLEVCSVPIEMPLYF
jgi:hypothetical protein